MLIRNPKKIVKEIKLRMVGCRNIKFKGDN